MKEENTYTINMVEKHIRTLNVIDDEVLGIIKNVPRTLFVPEKYKSFAHIDMQIPIGFDQHMLLPSVEAKILQAMNIKNNEDVLIVGSGTGYLSTCVSMLANHVHSIDTINSFVNESVSKTKSLKITNINFEYANILDRLDLIKNYKSIIFTSSIADMSLILNNMNNGASSFIFQSEDNFPVQKGIHIHKTNKSSFIKQYILETNVEPILTNKYD